MDITKEQIEALKKATGSRAKKLREAAGFAKVPSAAKELGVHNPTLYDIEDGTNFVSPEMLIKLSTLYGVPIAAFFTDEVVRIEPTPMQAWEIVGDALRSGPASTAAEDAEIARILAAVRASPSVKRAALDATEAFESARKDTKVVRRATRSSG